MVALTFGCALSASTVASARNGRNESLTPSRCSNEAFARARSRATLVRSTSTTVVSCADTCSDSTIRDAITLRSRDIFSVVPRCGATDGFAAGADAAGALGADAAGACGSGSGSGSAAFLAASAAARTSCLRIRPPTPVPVSEDRSTPCSDASLRTSGVT